MTALETLASRDIRRVEIEIVDNGYVVRITETAPEYKEVKLVFTSQAAMLKATKEATSIKRTDEEGKE